LGQFDRGGVASDNEERFQVLPSQVREKASHATLWVMMKQVSTCFCNLKIFRPSILVWDKG